ncbi:MAG: TIGR02678 family protein [Pseudomonadota bacterium]
MRDTSDLQNVLEKHREQERRDALRALLMQPLMTASHADFIAVRRYADELREWFSHTTGWILHVERDCARLYKRPADLRDDTRGAPDFERRRYVLFCLACAALERADPQITLRTLGERLLVLAADPELATRGFSFTLDMQHERRELVGVCRYLLELGVLHRVAGDEDAFVSRSGDALYDVQRRVLASMLAATRGPSTWAAGSAPDSLDTRLAALVEEYTPDSDEGRRTAVRHSLARRLLDDPVVYFDELDEPARAYFQNQRGPLAARLSDATGLVAEQRAEGLAMVDESGDLTDIVMPAEGTASHITLLVAEYLAGIDKQEPGRWLYEFEVAAFIRKAALEFGRYWRKSAREPGAEEELARDALARLAMLRLIERRNAAARALPALARFALGAPQLKNTSKPATQSKLFE